MHKKVIDKLIQKYLAGKTSRDEERTLLDLCLKDINLLINRYHEIKAIKNDKNNLCRR